MKRVIWSHILPLDDYVDIDMKIGAKVLSIGIQNMQICVWALVDPEAETAQYRFRIVGTGHPMADEVGQLDFIGTVMTLDDALAFHVFGMGISSGKETE